jgi:SAM-dependent methyltransferase
VENIFRRHAAAAAAVRPIEQADVLEIGPGGNLSVLKLFRASGARRATAIDVLPWVAAGSNDEDPPVEYLCPVTVEDLPFTNESFDIIYSDGCFQYVADPESAVDEIARVLRIGGVTTHMIDLSDPSHRDSADPLRFLRYRDCQWRLATSHRLFQVNRWRGSDFLEAFRKRGFKTSLEVTATVDVDHAYSSTFAPRFRGKSLLDLGTVGAFIVARKVAGSSTDSAAALGS